MKQEGWSPRLRKMVVDIIQSHGTTRDAAVVHQDMTYTQANWIFRQETGMTVTEYKKSDVVGRFLKHTRTGVADNCSPWEGAVDAGGYGQAPQFFSETGERKAHRVSFVLFNGPIPDDMVVRHKCDNPPCIRPSHLELGTDQDNYDDMVKRNRVNTKGWFKIKTHCIRNHELTGDNVRVTEKRRTCVVCERDRRERKR